jgi:hypothetical protein
MDDNKNIFDKDDTLDYILFEDMDKKNKNKSDNSGCFRILLLLILPVMVLCHLFFFS